MINKISFTFFFLHVGPSNVLFFTFFPMILFIFSLFLINQIFFNFYYIFTYFHFIYFCLSFFSSLCQAGHFYLSIKFDIRFPVDVFFLYSTIL